MNSRSTPSHFKPSAASNGDNQPFNESGEFPIPINPTSRQHKSDLRTPHPFFSWLPFKKIKKFGYRYQNQKRKSIKNSNISHHLPLFRIKSGSSLSGPGTLIILSISDILGRLGSLGTLGILGTSI
jgi:hypothetical protein